MNRTTTGTCVKNAALLALVAFAAAAQGAKVDGVKVRQLWPWSTDVKVEYTLSDVTGPVDVKVTAYDGERQIPQADLEPAIVGERFAISSGGVHTLKIDPIRAVGAKQVALADFKVRIDVADSPESMTEVIYKVIRLSDGDCRDLTKADFFNGKADGGYETDYRKIGSAYSTTLSDVLIWTGVTNNPAYRTTHIVMRKIKCKGVQWSMGDPSTLLDYNANAPTCQVVLTNDFWISVFPITVGQHNAVGASDSDRTKSYGSYPSDADTKSLCPATGWRENIREKNTLSWPANRHSVAASSWLGVMRGKTGYDFELPTEAQWEFAARGGVYSLHLYTGEITDTITKLDNALARIAWYNGNTKKDGKNWWHPVGSLRPNAYGLYDMLGSVAEYVLNRYYTYDTENVSYEPEGGETGDYVSRSYTIVNDYTHFRCGLRFTKLSNNGCFGCRVILPDTEGMVYPDWDKK